MEKMQARKRTPLPDLTPIENGERTYVSSLQVSLSPHLPFLNLLIIQVITESSRHSLLRDDSTRRSTLREEKEGGQRKSFFLDDNNMQSIIAQARDMQLKEDHESEM